ncbi:MAG: DedA family protein [Candidatus Kerfeldbacteria bacterium CG_4_10_14_0_8_um_filter_42_10]|uniref:DedA family protein n=1 Tax=Candidatus Kerfeldbacteria bacterium CG_4_10_14_0_8_um_filter_42_10 TaxID=2014248 RepID=A0A2M7RL67_9BACT|nr:MAG: DedA family protein [Candidatus Kerfeldbacteria bacterium CG_4_10_14_0_8_um_filter_42_10]
MGLTEFLIHYFTLIISQLGYWGVGLLMTLESMVAPVPSEAVMPFAGFLWFDHKFTFWGLAFSSTLGSIIGSLISYYVGAFGGRPLVKKFGKYLLLNEHHLDQTQRFFAKYGDKTIFISRFIPVIRHLISLPAGVGRMNLAKFSLYTVIGAGIWNSFLAYLGYYLGSRWEEIRKYSEILDIVIIVLIVGTIVVFFFKKESR